MRISKMIAKLQDEMAIMGDVEFIVNVAPTVNDDEVYVSPNAEFSFLVADDDDTVVMHIALCDKCDEFGIPLDSP